ncbi:hypothetical protein TUMSATVNIG1_32890 [Vibrio nigripulchritudo]|nr:hypothetical protein VNTUMSATTG_32600 [Vibrio nigripulchritudo]BDU32680.1 hypothetical protein TUMSATVNIG1_32890 [Vibrio nigripulchritudo]
MVEISVYQLIDELIEVGIFYLRRTFRFLSQSHRRFVLGTGPSKESLYMKELSRYAELEANIRSVDQY